MRKFFIILASLAVAGCMVSEISEETVYVNVDYPTYTATFDDEGTKVYVDTDLKMHWNAGDEISIFRTTGNQRYSFDGADGDREGTFSVQGDPQGGSELQTAYAVYPYSDNTSINTDGVITLNLPEVQHYAENSFGLGANTMVAVTESKDSDKLYFKNLCGYLVVKLYGEGTIKSITLTGNNGEKLSGQATVTPVFGEAPVLTMSESAGTSITLDCGEGVALESTAENATAFWFAVPPVTFTQGFTVTTVGSSGLLMKRTSVNRIVVRNTIQNMVPIELNSFASMVPPDDEIWYTTTNDGILWAVSNDSFDQAIVNNTYENGMGVIKFSGSLKCIRINAFVSSGNMKSLYLPDSVEEIEDYVMPINYELDVLYIPKRLSVFSGKSFSYGVIRRFEGDERVQENGLFVVVDNHIKLVAAPKEDNMTIPGTYEGIDDFAMWAPHPDLKTIVIEDGVRTLGPYAFSGCSNLEEVYLPNTLEGDGYSWFDLCDVIKRFHGPSKFVSEDGRTIFRYVPYYDSHGTRYLKFIMNIAKSGLVDYTVDEEIEGIDPESFCRACDLQSITFKRRDFFASGDTFDECYSLEHIYGPGASDDGRCLIGKGVSINCQYEKDKLLVFAGKGITDYTVNEKCEEIGSGVFAYWDNLKNIVIPDYITRLGNSVFWGCSGLETVTLPALLQYVGNDIFTACPNLRTIDVRAIIPPKFENYSDNHTANLGIMDGLTSLKINVPKQSVELYKTTFPWSLYASHIYGETFTYPCYVSSDFSHDGETTILQHSISDNGIDLVLMGDGFSDRQVADGTYAKVMNKAMNAFFSEEPYKSFKDRFNVSYVNVVSMTEGYEQAGQTLGTGFGDGANVYGNDKKVVEYAKNAVSEDKLDDALVIVMMNIDAYAGTCYMYFPEVSSDYGHGLSIAYFPTSSDTDTFNGLVSHEAGGHGFAKLADEYAYEYMGAVSDEVVSNRRSQTSSWGWWKNVDFTGDPTQVRWAQFIADSRYAAENIGCYEGAFTYWTGAWRPTENSIMRYNTGGFNAPSRYAIWYRINKLAYGDSWNGTYEDFVQYDAVNRTPAAVARRNARRNCVEKNLPPLAPPVVLGHSWRDAK